MELELKLDEKDLREFGFEQFHCKLECSAEDFLKISWILRKLQEFDNLFELSLKEAYLKDDIYFTITIDDTEVGGEVISEEETSWWDVLKSAEAILDDLLGEDKTDIPDVFKEAF